MSVLILSCPCGLRMKAKGATPGRVGRCPKCGQTLTVPETPESEVRARVETKAEPVARGYGLNPTFRPAVADPEGKRPARKGSKGRAAEPARLPEVAREIEPWWRPDVLFPLRGAEGLMIVAMMGPAAWVVATLTPEFCLQLVAEGGLMGVLVSLIVAIPPLLLGFFAVTYVLQYLGRVLVSASMGEVVPPRPPDRNFDGLSNGLAPWAVWLAGGATLGLGPLASYLLSRGGDGTANPVVVALLAGIGLPYALMALMMAFVRDGFPSPFDVVAALLRFNLAFLAVCAVETGLALAGGGAFAALLWLREGYYWVYLPLMLAGWMLAVWLAIVGMRMLGVFYHRHASVLRWHRKKPWWDVTIGS